MSRGPVGSGFIFQLRLFLAPTVEASWDNDLVFHQKGKWDQVVSMHLSQFPVTPYDWQPTRTPSLVFFSCPNSRVCASALPTSILFIFLMWTILKVFIEFFFTVLLLFYVLVFWLRGMWDPRSLTRDRTDTLGIGRRSLNHWTAREVPRLFPYSLFTMRSPFLTFLSTCRRPEAMDNSFAGS